ncbi:hypothetical protein KY334_01485, partial [Candidatus Woesearchaeota archaeon]|nr:hypothetical protein [Candidatus Woesearchaeota archaeon]
CFDIEGNQTEDDQGEDEDRLVERRSGSSSDEFNKTQEKEVKEQIKVEKKSYSGFIKNTIKILVSGFTLSFLLMLLLVSTRRKEKREVFVNKEVKDNKKLKTIVEKKDFLKKKDHKIKVHKKGIDPVRRKLDKFDKDLKEFEKLLK